MHVAQWQIFLDESGDFSRATTTWLVGWAIQGPATQAHDQRLRRALADAYAGVPWPMHASALNLPIAHALYRIADVPAPPDVLAACARAVKTLSSSNALEARAYMEAAQKARHGGGKGGRIEVDHCIARNTETWLQREDPTALASLRQLQAQQDRAMRHLLRTLAGGAHGAGAFALAVECEPEHDTSLGAAWWVDAFEVLVGRGVDLLRSATGAGDQVLVRSAAYDGVSGPRLGARSQTIARAPWFPTTASCIIFPTRPLRYDDQVSAGVVVADFLANRIKRSLYGALDVAATRVSRDLGLPIVAVPRSAPDGPGLPACAATGLPHRALQAARRAGPVPLAPDQGARAWKVEQALAWMHAPRGGVA
jgi:hypothetical protein